MDERRYSQAEVRKILELATSPGALVKARPEPAQGLTLDELQGIAEEVGVSRDLVAQAAASLDARPPRPLRRSLGMPIEVGRIVPLPREMTDREWEQLVGELRMTFGARGRTTVQGGLREWSNGNLHACVEPAGSGYRLRLGTVKGDANGVNALGATGLVAGSIAGGSLIASGEIAGSILLVGLLGGAGVAAFLANLLRLPRWARQRARQMEYIGARAQAIVAAPQPAESPEPHEA